MDAGQAADKTAEDMEAGQAAGTAAVANAAKEGAAKENPCENMPTLDSTLVVRLTMVGMIIFYVLGHFSAKEEGMYRPGTLPFLNLIGSAFLLCTLFDEDVVGHVEDHMQFKKGTGDTPWKKLLDHLTKNKQVWVLLATLAVLILSSAISPSPSPSLAIKVKLASASDATQFSDWVQNTATHRGKVQAGMSVDTVRYTTSIESNLDMEDVVNEIETQYPTAQVTSMQVSKGESISVGLIVAVVINFALDGLMVGPETCTTNNVDKKIYTSWIGKLFGKLFATKTDPNQIYTSKIGGFLFDNFILMMILGYQFTRAKTGGAATWGGMFAFVLVFWVSMKLGLKDTWLTRLAKNNEETVTTITFAVVVYTIFVELMPEATVFRDFDGNLIDAEEGGVKNYESIWMPLVFFLAVLAYRTFAG